MSRNDVQWPVSTISLRRSVESREIPGNNINVESLSFILVSYSKKYTSYTLIWPYDINKHHTGVSTEFILLLYVTSNIMKTFCFRLSNMKE